MVKKGEMKMRLKKDNIEFVTRLEYDGVTYCWIVVMKSHKVSDTRHYVNYDMDNRTVVKDYPVDWLPESVKKFINSHAEIQIESTIDTSDINEHYFNRYRYM